MSIDIWLLAGYIILMIDLIPDVFITQILHREDGVETMLGYIGEFEGGIPKRYKKGDPHYMYKDFVHSFHCSKDGIKWSRIWDTHSGAIRRLAKMGGKDVHNVMSRIIPIPQTFKKGWRNEDEEDEA